MWYGVAAYGMRLCLIAMVFGPYVRDAQTARLSMFSHYFKRVARLPKLATSSLLLRGEWVTDNNAGTFKRKEECCRKRCRGWPEASAPSSELSLSTTQGGGM